MRRQAKAIVAISAMLLTLALGVTLAGAVAPDVTIDSGVTSVSYTSAHVSGTVDPQDQETYYYFQYSKDPVGEGWTSGAFQGPISAGAGVQNVSDDLGGLAGGTEYEVRLAANNFVDPEVVSSGPNPTFTTDPVSPPSISINPVTTTTGTTAHFSGTINPNAPEAAPTSPEVEAAFKVNWRFECTPACSGLDGGQVAADNTNHVVEADVSGLEPNTDYEVTLVASNAGAPASDGPEAFKTEGGAPEVQTLYAGPVDTDSATLAANINPRNSPVTYQFEWGTDGSYGNIAPATPQSLGVEDNSFHLVTAPISGLQPGTDYHFRVVATNSDTFAQAEGEDHVFGTLAAVSTPSSGLPDGRVYEKVSPGEKAGADIQNDSTADSMARASASGDAIAYYSLGTFDGKSGPLYNQYLSTRIGDPQWSTQGLNPVLDASSTIAARTSYHLFSEDLSKAIVGTRMENRPWNLYLRDNLTDSFEWLSKPADSVPEDSGGTFFNLIGAAATADFGHIVFESDRRLTAEVEPGALAIYDRVGDELRVASILPDGSVADGTKGVWLGGQRLNSAHYYYPGDYAVSVDGSRIFFTVQNSGTPNLYMRENDTVTHRIGDSECTDPDCISPGDANYPTFQAASADGSIVFFSSGMKLTDDSTASFSRPDLYRWDLDAPVGHRLTDLTTTDPSGGGVGAGLFDSDGQVPARVGSAADGSSIYFVASGDLAPGSRPGRPSIFRWDEDSGLRHVVTLAPGEADIGVWESFRARPIFRDARVTSDGSRLFFASHEQLTGYDTNGTKQIYLYDADQDSLVCVSCSKLSAGSSADSQFQSHSTILNLDGQPVKSSASSPYLPRNMSPDGERVFFDTKQQLVPGDSNGRVDVYVWENGQVNLISTGQSDDDSFFSEASVSGNDVFFTTREKLVLSDRDTVMDMYDARVGGSPESQTLVPCVGDECQGTPVPPSSFESPGTASFSGPGSSSVRDGGAKRCAKNRKKQRFRGKTGCVRKHTRNSKRSAGN